MLGLLTSTVVVAGCSSPGSAGPVPAPTPTEAVITAPVDPEDTGVPPGVTLRESGPLRLVDDGAVVDGLDVDGCVTVRADDVTIRNSRIRCGKDGVTLAVEVEDDSEGLVVESSEIDGLGRAEVGVGWGSYTLRKVDIHGTADGARFGHRVRVEQSWIHDMARIGDLHSDALQTTSAGDVVIVGNVLDPAQRGDGDPGEPDYNNAGLMLGSETGTKQVRDVLVEHNRFDGGNYSLNVRGDIDAEGVVIRDNVFGDGSRYGAVIAPSSVELGPGNVLERSGAPVEVVRAKP